MEQLRRRRLLKPLLSLALVLLSLLTLHRLKLGDRDTGDVGDNPPREAYWCDPGCDPSKPGADGDGEADGDGDVDGDPGRNLSSWDTQASNCTEDSSVRSQDWFGRLEPRFQQFVLRRHCRYFPMLLNHPEKCRGGGVHLLVAVKSVVEHHDRREAVRRTWGREGPAEGAGGGRISTVFLLGRSTAGGGGGGGADRNLQKLLEYEDRVYGDILQWDFADTFFNLTLKEVNFLRWFRAHCPGVRFVFKGDDDVFVNTRNLLRLIGFKEEARADADLMVGDAIVKAAPIRNRQSKYYIPRELYDGPYPPYVGGGGFLMSSSMARRLHAASEGVELYPIDDVFLGMCLEKLRVRPETHPGFRTFGITRGRGGGGGGGGGMNKEPCFYKQLILVHRLEASELLRMWAEVQRDDLVCSRKTSVLHQRLLLH